MSPNDYFYPSLKKLFLPLLAVSETTDKFRVPPLHPTESFDPLKNLVPPAPFTIVHKPFLRYHGQSLYTDCYPKPHFTSGFMLRTADIGSWSDPVGKKGDFFGPSTYERQYLWPPIPEVKRIPPPQPTVGWGIIPILGTGEEEVLEEKKPLKPIPVEKK